MACDPAARCGNFARMNPTAEAVPSRESAFTRGELVAVIALVVVLGGVVALTITRPRTKAGAVVCKDNLRQLGAAMAVYAGENDTRLPYAFLMMSNPSQISWDTLLRPALRAATPDTAGTNGNSANRTLLCPADTISSAEWAQKYKLARRTYSMTRHNMSPQNWPPSSTNSTGLGINWSFGPRGTNPPSPKIYNADGPQAAVRLGIILQPSETLFLAEHAWTNNIVGNAAGAWIDRTSAHTEPAFLPPATYHRGRFNYLQVDGRVELLAPDQTVGPNGLAGDDPKRHQGIWTIKAHD